MKTRERDTNADIIRIMACIIVIGVHCDLLVNHMDSSQTLWRILLGDGVTYFFILMGFFLFKERPFLTLLKKSFWGVMFPGFITMLLIRMFFPWLDNQDSLLNCISLFNLDWKEYVKAIINWSPGAGIGGYLWYIFTYMQVVLLVPLMKSFCKKDIHGEKLEVIRLYIIGLNLIGLVLADVMAFINISITVEPYKVLTIPAMLVISGYSVYCYRDRLKGNRIYRRRAMVLAIVLELIRWKLQIGLFELQQDNTHYLYWNTSFAFCITLCMVVVILTIEINSIKFRKAISYVGEQTFYIYLIHYPIQHFLDVRGFSDNLIKILTGDRGYLALHEEIIYIFIRVTTIFTLSMVLALVIKYMLLICKKILKNAYCKSIMRCKI